MEPTDEELVATVLSGRREAFSTLVRRHQDAVYSVCRHFLGNAEEARDATQETFVRAYGRMGRLHDPRAFGSWLRGIAAHVALDLARQRQRLLARPEVNASEVGASGSSASGPERCVAAREPVDEVRKTIASLPEAYRMVAVLRFGLQMKYFGDRRGAGHQRGRGGDPISARPADAA